MDKSISNCISNYISNYNSNFICTYKLIEEKSDFADEADILYKIQFLQAFNIEEYNSEIINKEVEILFNKLNNDNDMKEKFHEILKPNDFYNNNKDSQMLAFMSLFSYNTFHIFHLWLCEYLNDKNIKQETHDKLKYLLNKK